MSNLARFNPLRRIARHSDPFNWVDRFFDPSPWATAAWPNAPKEIDLDITDKGNSYLVEAEIPGVKKEDISISINGNQVSISAEIKSQTEKKELGNTLCSERYYGRTFRSFTLDRPIDESHTKASYADGILKIELPKKEDSSSKHITIS